MLATPEPQRWRIESHNIKHALLSFFVSRKRCMVFTLRLSYAQQSYFVAQIASRHRFGVRRSLLLQMFYSIYFKKDLHEKSKVQTWESAFFARRSHHLCFAFLWRHFLTTPTLLIS